MTSTEMSAPAACAGSNESLRIHVVVPITTKGFRTAEDFASYAGPGISVTISEIENGPASIESEFEDSLATPGILEKALLAQRGGADAIVIDCMADPGLMAAREVLDIPAFGPCQTSMSVASLIAHRYGYLTIMDELIPVTESRAATYGQRDKFAGIRSVNVPVLELEADRERTVALLLAKSKELIDIGAGALIFGCTGLMWAAEALEQGLSASGYPGVRVINPMPTTINIAGAVLRSGLSVSKKNYPHPPSKKIIGYPAFAGGFATLGGGGVN